MEVGMKVILIVDESEVFEVKERIIFGHSTKT